MITVSIVGPALALGIVYLFWYWLPIPPGLKYWRQLRVAQAVVAGVEDYKRRNGELPPVLYDGDVSRDGVAIHYGVNDRCYVVDLPVGFDDYYQYDGCSGSWRFY